MPSANHLPMNTQPIPRSNRGSLTVGGLIAIVVLVATVIFAFAFVKVRTVEANEEAVVQTWSGIEPVTRTQGTYFLVPGWSHSLYAYDMGIHVYVMNDKDGREEVGEGRKGDAYVVQSKDQQDMRISLRVQWQRRSNASLIALHRKAPTGVEEKLLRPAVQNVVKNEATLRTALDAYSGEGLVKLQGDILKGLQAHGELNEYVEVKGFVIEHIGLNPEYTKEIVARQVAIQERLKNVEQTRAAESAAEKAKALAQADYEKVLVEARRDKEKAILEQQAVSEKAIIAAKATAENTVVTQKAESEKVVIAAKADAERVTVQAKAEAARNIAISDAQKLAEQNRAVGIKAVGEATADANKLLLSSYAVPGSDLYTRIQVAGSLATSFAGVKGYLPQGVTYNTVASSFDQAVSLLVAPAAAK